MTVENFKKVNEAAGFTLAALAQIVGGQLNKAEHATVLIQGVGTIEQAKTGELCFLENTKYQKFLETTQASAVLIQQSMIKNCAMPMIIVENPKLAFAKIMGLIYPEKTREAGIHPSVVMGKNSHIDPSVYIGPNCVLGDNVTLASGVSLSANIVIGDDCTIGKNSYLHPNVCLYSDVKLGENNTIHSGVVIGSDGFGFANDKGNWVKLPHIGGVVIGNQVEIGANTTIDRGVIEDTIIEDGVILDNLVQIAHNVHIGAHTAIAASTGIAGSAKVGRYCQISGGALVNGHISLVDQTCLLAGSVVPNSIKKPGIYASFIPAREHALWVKNIARFHHLDELAGRLKTLEKLVLEKTEDL